jgi:hypothetical protein
VPFLMVVLGAVRWRKFVVGGCDNMKQADGERREKSERYSAWGSVFDRKRVGNCVVKG